MNKISTAVAFGTGYVLGARAGRQRYDELRERAQEVWTDPKLQQQAKKMQEQAKHVPGQVKEHLPGSKGGSPRNSADQLDSGSSHGPTQGADGTDVPEGQTHG